MNILGRMHTLCLLFAMLFLVACGTNGAVFSDKELKAGGTELSPEEQFEIENFTNTDCTEWERGKPFLYVSDELNILLLPVDGGRAPAQSFRNKLFTFHSMREESLYGVPQASLIFECDGVLYKFETNRSFESLLEKNYVPFLPHMVSLDKVERAKKVLMGKQLYIKTPVWYNKDHAVVNGRKMVLVTITDVTAGTERLPARIEFVDERGKRACVLMNLPTNDYSRMYQTFHKLFDFEDPHLSYPTIEDKHWNLITQSMVCKGMTKDECKLALGLPSEVRRVPTYSGLIEHWFYSSGMHYQFEDGLLTQTKIR